MGSGKTTATPQFGQWNTGNDDVAFSAVFKAKEQEKRNQRHPRLDPANSFGRASSEEPVEQNSFAFAPLKASTHAPTGPMLKMGFGSAAKGNAFSPEGTAAAAGGKPVSQHQTQGKEIGSGVEGSGAHGTGPAQPSHRSSESDAAFAAAVSEKLKTRSSGDLDDDDRPFRPMPVLDPDDPGKGYSVAFEELSMKRRGRSSRDSGAAGPAPVLTGRTDGGQGRTTHQGPGVAKATASPATAGTAKPKDWKRRLMFWKKS